MKKTRFFKAGLKTCFALFLFLNSQYSNGTEISLDRNGGCLKGTQDGYYYELWVQDNDDPEIKVNDRTNPTWCDDNHQGWGKMDYATTGCTYKCSWGDNYNFLARRGHEYNTDKTHLELGTFSAVYECKYSTPSNGTSYLAVYGWTKDDSKTAPNDQIEYYIIENYANWRPPHGDDNSQMLGSAFLASNGSTYEFYYTTRTGPNKFSNTAREFGQFYAVRVGGKVSGNPVTVSGTVPISQIFAEFDSRMPVKMGKINEVSFVTEGYANTGTASAEFTALDVTLTNSTDVPVDSVQITGYNVDFLRNGLDKVHWMSTNDQVTLKYDIYPTNATNKEVDITINDANIAEVTDNNNGTFTVRTKNTGGEAKITVTPKDSNGDADELTIASVEDFDIDIAFQDPILVNNTFTLPLLTGYQDIKYIAVYKDVATVNTAGLVTAKGPGKTFVVACGWDGTYWIGEEYYIIEVIAAPAPGGSRIEISGLGTQGGEEGALIVNGDILRTFRFSQNFETFVADVSYKIGDIKIEFTNDDGIENGRDLRLDYIKVNGVKRETEAMAINTGAYANGVCGGGSYTEWMHCNGSVNYGPISTPHTITIRARGIQGNEHINLLIDGAPVNSGWVLSSGFQEYTATVEGDGDINIQYDNDYGDYRDVVVDWIRVDNQNVRQAENMQYNTAYYANGRCGGGSYSEWMNCNGVIGFGKISDDFKSAQPSDAINNLSTVSIYPNPSSGDISIELLEVPTQDTWIKIYNTTGKVVYSKSGISDNLINVSGLRSGLYLVQISDNSFNYNKKLVVR